MIICKVIVNITIKALSLLKAIYIIESLFKYHFNKLI